MLRPRIIPCLLVKDKGLVKTVRFRRPTYVGDPINAVRIFNEKEVDELMLLDIDAAVNGSEPDYQMIEHIAAECRMPLCYGGGVNSLSAIQRIIALGAEKVAISSAAISQPTLIAEAAAIAGSQSVVVVLDVKRHSLGGSYEVYTHNGRRRTRLCPVAYAIKMAELGAGEILVNSIDEDGRMSGYNTSLVRSIRDAVGVPVTAMGGAGSLSDIAQVITEAGVSGAAAGSIFVFKGIHRAVLINYPNPAEKEAILGLSVQSVP